MSKIEVKVCGSCPFRKSLGDPADTQGCGFPKNKKPSFLSLHYLGNIANGIPELCPLKNSPVTVRLYEQGFVEIGDTVHDRDGFLITPGGKMKLTPTQNKIMSYFTNRPNTICSNEDLCFAVYGKNTPEKLRTIQVYIATIKKHLASDKTIELKSEYGKGYVLVVPE